MNYLRIDEDLLVAGVVLRDDPTASKARSKMLAAVGREVVPLRHLLAIADRAAQVEAQVQSEIEGLKSGVIADYITTEAYKSDVINLLQPSLQQTFAQVHDYRQLVTQIVQNVNVLLQSEHPDADFDALLDAAPTSLRAIYWSARLMEVKLDSALFLAYPERISDPNKVRTFRLHGAVKKYISIYTSPLALRRLRLREHGSTFGNLMANPDAVGVIPHAFLDNAIKYAPEGSDIDVSYTESEAAISMSISSLGPRIAKEEVDRLFEIFFRGEAARRSGEDGTGFGLGLASHVAKAIDAELSVFQESQPAMEAFYRTEFTATFPKPTADDRPSPLVRARIRSRGGRPTLL